MKKIACALAAIVALGTLTGCPAFDKDNDDDKDETAQTEVTETAEDSDDVSDENSADSGNNNSDAAAGNSADSGASSDESNASTAESVEDEDAVKIVAGTVVFREGTWCFTTYDSNGVEKFHLYVGDSNELIDFEPEGSIADVSGYLVAYENGLIKNVKTNEVYCDPNEGMSYIKTREFIKRYSSVFAADGTALIKKEVADFDSSAVYYGVLNSDGTWRNELNENTGLVDIYNNTKLFYLGNGYVAYEDYYSNGDMSGDGFFCIDNNQYLDNTAFGRTVRFGPVYLYSNGENAFFINSDAYYHEVGKYANINGFYSYDNVTNSSNLIVDNTDIRDFTSNLCYTPSGRYMLISATEDTHIAYDMETNEKIVFPTAGYSIRFNNHKEPALSVVGNTFLFECTGADGIDYICAINTDGERVIEPREMWYRCTVGDKYLCNVDGVLTMFDSVTGAETALEGDLIVDGKHVYGDESVIVVETADGYKLIDLNEPEKIYSPFES